MSAWKELTTQAALELDRDAHSSLAGGSYRVGNYVYDVFQGYGGHRDSLVCRIVGGGIVLAERLIPYESGAKDIISTYEDLLGMIP